MKQTEEKILRENIRQLIRFVKQKKEKVRLDEETQLRSIINKFVDYELSALKEIAIPDNKPTPNKSTGINVLEDLLTKIIPVLETDYKLMTTNPEQRESFRAHIAACRETGLPLIVHTRDADDDTMDILEEEYEKGPFTGVIHCFSSSAALAQRALKIGFYISCSGIITFNSAKEIRAALEDVPLDRLLVETDAPYLAPVPKRGKPNEPSYVAHTAAKLAEIKAISVEE